jgi:feruloyl-CoA synthase
VVAVVVADGDLSLADLRAFCGERLARYKVPRDLVIADALPRNPSGKLTKHVLREQLAAQEPADQALRGPAPAP